MNKQLISLAIAFPTLLLTIAPTLADTSKKSEIQQVNTSIPSGSQPLDVRGPINIKPATSGLRPRPGHQIPCVHQIRCDDGSRPGKIPIQNPTGVGYPQLPPSIPTDKLPENLAPIK